MALEIEHCTLEIDRAIARCVHSLSSGERKGRAQTHSMRSIGNSNNQETITTMPGICSLEFGYSAAVQRLGVVREICLLRVGRSIKNTAWLVEWPWKGQPKEVTVL